MRCRWVTFAPLVTLGVVACAGGKSPTTPVASNPARAGDVEPKVKALIADQFGVPPDRLAPGTDLTYDLNADKLDWVELIMELEEAFEIHIPDDQASTARTVGDLVGLVRRLATRPGPGRASTIPVRPGT